MKITIEGQFKPRWIGDTPAPLVRFWCTDLCDSEVCVGDPGPKMCPILKTAREKGTLVGDRIRVFYPSDAQEDCEVCGGKGKVFCPGCRTSDKFITMARTRCCARCGGEGLVDCPACKGAEPQPEHAGEGKFHPPWPPDGPDDERRSAFFEARRAGLPTKGAFWFGFPIDEMTRDELLVVIVHQGRELERQQAMRYERAGLSSGPRR